MRRTRSGLRRRQHAPLASLDPTPGNVNKARHVRSPTLVPPAQPLCQLLPMAAGQPGLIRVPFAMWSTLALLLVFCPLRPHRLNPGKPLNFGSLLVLPASSDLIQVLMNGAPFTKRVVARPTVLHPRVVTRGALGAAGASRVMAAGFARQIIATTARPPLVRTSISWFTVRRVARPVKPVSSSGTPSRSAASAAE